jgi:hypothetical protein
VARRVNKVQRVRGMKEIHGGTPVVSGLRGARASPTRISKTWSPR